MPDPCPDPAVLAAWSDGRAPDGTTADAVERHLEQCPRCGEWLERLNHSRLGPLNLAALRHGDGAEQDGAPGPERALVHRLIEAALEGGKVSTGDPLQEFLDGLQPATRSDCLGRFAGLELEESVGRGGMGIVFRAFDPTLRRRVALKILLHEGRTAGDAAAAGHFLREARAIAALRHPHVVEVYSAGLENGWPFLVMPFHEQGTLQRWIDDGRPVSPVEVAHLGIQLLRALEFTHSQGILHRDLKPSNVLLEQGLDHVRLADFGLAQTMVDTPAAGTRFLAGTPEYMSPEQLRGERLDARSDLYGMGALLRSLLLGAALRDGTGVDDADRGTGRPVGDSKELRDVLERFLAPVAAERPRDATAARLVLEDLLPRLGGVPARVGSRWPWAAAAAGVFALLLAVVVGLERTGRTAVVNGMMCRTWGDGYYVHGRWGTYAVLDAAAAACQPGEVVVARFSDERPMAPLRVGSRGLHVRAAAGFRPALISTNTEEALILALGPVVLEGLTLISRADSGDGGQLIAAEGAAVRLVHCRLLRVRSAGDDVLVKSGQRVDPDFPQMIHRPLLAIRSGSSVVLRKCVVAGLAATGIGLRCTGAGPIHVEMDQSLFAIHRCFVLRPDSTTPVTLHARDSAFAAATLFEIENAQVLDRFEARWERCLVDRSGGVLLRWGRGGDGAWLERMTWTEDRVVYAGSGAFAWDRRRGTIGSEAEWNRLARLSGESHRSTPRPLFGESRLRSVRRLEAADVDVSGLAADTGWPATFRPDEIGAGPAYDRFRDSLDPPGIPRE